MGAVDMPAMASRRLPLLPCDSSLERNYALSQSPTLSDCGMSLGSVFEAEMAPTAAAAAAVTPSHLTAPTYNEWR